LLVDYYAIIIILRVKIDIITLTKIFLQPSRCGLVVVFPGEVMRGSLSDGHTSRFSLLSRTRTLPYENCYIYNAEHI
jgi:hypothetical protein